MGLYPFLKVYPPGLPWLQGCGGWQGLPGLTGLLTGALRLVDGLRGFEVLSRLSRLHRVQGSPGLLEAARLVAGVFEERGATVEYRVLRGRLGLGGRYGFWEPRGWRLYSGVVEAWEAGGWREVVSTRVSPLAVLAHSPPGVVEGRLLAARPLEGVAPPGDAIALTSDPIVDYVLLGWERAVVGFHEGPGLRYWGLYPPPDLPEPRGPAAGLGFREASRLLGKRVRVSVDSEYTEPVTPLVAARFGDPDGGQVLLVAHLCHPRPGAHDNASGVAVLSEAAAALAGFEKLLAERGVGVTLLAGPEWVGTAAAIEEGLVDPERLVAVVSVDMVAANHSVTGGEPRLVSSLPPKASLLEPALYAALEAAGVPHRRVFYEWGSDHDVGLGHGVPGVMVNDWPDKYYHTSMDTPDHIEPGRIGAIAAAVAAATVYALTSPGAAAPAASRWGQGLLYETALARGGSLEAAAKLAEMMEEELKAQTVLVERGEKPATTGGVEPGRRPPYSKQHIALHYPELLRDRRLREAAGLAAVAAASTGSWEAAVLLMELLHGKPPESQVLQWAAKLLEAEPPPRETAGG